jgi:hypothetical protein
MGHSLVDLGELEEARDAFHRAVMVTRVNSGPNGLEQTNYLFSLADIEFRVGNQGGAVGALDQIYRIHAWHHGADNPEMLPVLERISRWYTDRLAQNAQPALPSDYQNLSFLAERTAYLTEARYGLRNPLTAEASRAAAQAHYRAIYQVALTGQFPEPEFVMKSDDGDRHGGPDRTLLDHFLAGEAALERAAQSWEENPDASDLQIAESLAQVGDWNLAFERYREAERNYEQAYRVLAASEAFSALAEKYLGQPTPIRIMNESGPLVRDLDAPAAADSLDIRMTVKANGRLQDVEVVDAPAGLPEEQLRELEEILDRALFRPAVVDGEVRTLEGFVWRIPALRSDAETSSGPGR